MSLKKQCKDQEPGKPKDAHARLICMLTRRDWIRLGIGVPTSLAAMPGLGFASKEFWEAKPSSEWSSSEVERMITKSPWAKEVTISTPGRGNGYPNSANRRGGGGGIGFPGGGIGFPGGGGLGYPGGGRYPNGGGYPNGGNYPNGGPNGGNYPNDGSTGSRTYHATLRWESAAPIQEALRIGADDKPNPDFAKYYVLNLVGDLPDPTDRQRGYDDDRPSTTTCNNCNTDDDRSRDDQDADERTRRRLAMYKEYTKLERKDGFLRLEKVTEGSRFGSSSPGTAFYFSRLDNITIEDKLISFYTKIGQAEVRAKFTLKEMMYQGKLAV